MLHMESKMMVGRGGGGGGMETKFLKEKGKALSNYDIMICYHFILFNLNTKTVF